MKKKKKQKKQSASLFAHLSGDQKIALEVRGIDYTHIYI